MSTNIPDAGFACKGGPLCSCGTVSRIIHEFSESFGNAIDAKDHCTKSHSEEVAEAARILAVAYGLKELEAEIIHIAGHLHDVGKIGVPDCVLRKQGPLDNAQWRLMAEHPRIGADIVRPVGVLAEAGIPEMVLHHHERWDGGGYPAGLKGTAIPLGAQIIAVADSLSAMMQNRPYRSAMSFDEAAEEIRRCAGTQFNPELVEVFNRAEGDLRQRMETMGAGEGEARVRFSPPPASRRSGGTIAEPRSRSAPSTP